MWHDIPNYRKWLNNYFDTDISWGHFYGYFEVILMFFLKIFLQLLDFGYLQYCICICSLLWCWLHTYVWVIWSCTDVPHIFKQKACILHWWHSSKFLCISVPNNIQYMHMYIHNHNWSCEWGNGRTYSKANFMTLQFFSTATVHICCIATVAVLRLAYSIVERFS